MYLRKGRKSIERSEKTYKKMSGKKGMWMKHQGLFPTYKSLNVIRSSEVFKHTH